MTVYKQFVELSNNQLKTPCIGTLCKCGDVIKASKPWYKGIFKRIIEGEGVHAYVPNYCKIKIPDNIKTYYICEIPPYTPYWIETSGEIAASKMKIIKKLYFPITRIQVLKDAKKYSNTSVGICGALYNVLVNYNILDDTIYRDYRSLPVLFPKFIRENAIPFGASEKTAYWWRSGDWESGRMDFLNWLIEQYKDDSEDLREVELNYESVKSANYLAVCALQLENN